MTTRLTAPLASHVSYTKEVLARAHRDFAKNPSATHWNVLTRAAFTYQQIEYANRTHTIDREKLAFDLDSNPINEWQNVICRATVGAGILDALNNL
jgi:predicted amidohydrolase